MAENVDIDAESLNRIKIMHGIFKHQVVTTSMDDDEAEWNDDGGGTSADKSLKKKKSKSKDSQWSKKYKADPNAPSFSRIPMPEMSDSWKAARNQALTEIARRAKLTPDKPPAICFYTLLNTHSSVCSVEISEDSSLLCAGLGNSTMLLWSIDGQKMKPLKKSAELEKIDKDADDIFDLILDDSSASSRLTFTGHSGPVYGTSMSIDKKMVLSCSEDSTVRLWSMQTWTNLVVYRLCDLPVWDVKFCPYDYYFATGGADKCAMLWALDRQQPLRIFAGHDSDVNCVNFHPNVNYVATGSDDKTVRMWDVLNGECVRLFKEHTAPIQCLRFSFDGKMLAAGSSDGRVLLWDVGHGTLLADLSAPETDEDQPVYSLAFSHDNTVLAVGGADNKITLHYLANVQQDLASDIGQSQIFAYDKTQMGEFYTKSTPVLQLHFTRRNLLLGAGSYGQ